jgi:hypothetical protein
MNPNPLPSLKNLTVPLFITYLQERCYSLQKIKAAYCKVKIEIDLQLQRSINTFRILFHSMLPEAGSQVNSCEKEFGMVAPTLRPPAIHEAL